MPTRQALRVIQALLALALIWEAAPARAQEDMEGGEMDGHAGAPVARAVPVDGRIEVDGRLDEASWAAATPVTQFTQWDPFEGEPASERTDVRILFDDEALYIGARLYDRSPVSTRLVRRDAFAQDADWFEVSLDTYHDHLSSSTFAVNPSGVRRDQTGGGFFGGGGGGGGGGSEWNPVWEVATEVTDSGWVAEMRIPFSQLRFGRAASQTWGLQLERSIARNREQAHFAFTPKNERGGVARYGHLEGLTGMRASDPLEIVPYVSGRADYRRVPTNAAVDFSNPFRDGSDFTGGFGADLQYRVSSNFTLNATVNPDFGQVEVDPAVINLTAFETRLQENRPFFIEGADIFRFGGGGGGQILYSRRIGRAPSLGEPDGSAYIDMPDQARILGAAKLTGRTSNGWSIGILEAVTNKEIAPYVDEQNFQRRAPVEPLANYFTSRVKRDFNAGMSTVGMIVTSTHRRLEDENMRRRLRSSAFAGGVDFRHEWADRVWSINGFFAPSLIRGSRDVIISAQNSSARYYSRPDADHLSVDSMATSLFGYTADLDFGKRAGAWTGNVGFGAVSPGYEINDLGFQTTADRLTADGNLNYRQNSPGSLFRNWSVGTGPQLTWNYAGDLVDAYNRVNLNGQLLNYWGGGINGAVGIATMSDRLTRGGPRTRDPVSANFGWNINSDSRRKYTVGGNGSMFFDEEGSRRTSVGFNVGIKAASNWDLRLEPDFSHNKVAAQYVESRSDASAVNTYGRSYIFAELDQKTVSLDTRLNVTFTPELSLELFAQPLISTGEYGPPKALAAPKTFDFVPYTGTVRDRDFNTRSLRGNAVVRWEWRPGSTLFLVWQQSRSETLDALAVDPSFGRVGSFDVNRDARELFGLRPDNVFMIKATYWLNP